MRVSARISASGLPLAERHADAAVARERAGAGQDEIAHAGQAGERLEPSAEGDGELRHLVETARDQRRGRVRAEAEAFEDAGGDGDDVLQRAGQLDAGDVVRVVEAERRRRHRVLHLFARAPDRATRRPPPSDRRAPSSSANVGPDSTANARSASPQLLAVTSDIRCSVSFSMPFVPLTMATVAAKMRPDLRRARRGSDGSARP